MLNINISLIHLYNGSIVFSIDSIVYRLYTNNYDKTAS